jgi:hypothetical protein
MRKPKKRPPEGSTYEVGFAKPPESGKFQKGQSGNRKGRPAHIPRSMTAIVQGVLDEQVYVEALKRKVSYLELAIRQAAAHAAKGDHKSLRMLFQIMQFAIKYKSITGEISLEDLDRMILEMRWDLERQGIEISEDLK